MNSHPPSGHRHRHEGFSLIETVLALGIMALAITALLGLLPQGIEMSRKAANGAAETRILDTLTSQLTAMPYQSLIAQNMRQLHFDDQGIEVDNTQDIALSTYFVRVLVPAATTGVVLPGAALPEPKLQRVNIQIVQTPLSTYNFDIHSSKSYTTIPVLIAPQSP